MNPSVWRAKQCLKITISEITILSSFPPRTFHALLKSFLLTISKPSQNHLETNLKTNLKIILKPILKTMFNIFQHCKTIKQPIFFPWPRAFLVTAAALPALWSRRPAPPAAPPGGPRGPHRRRRPAAYGGGNQQGNQHGRSWDMLTFLKSWGKNGRKLGKVLVGRKKLACWARHFWGCIKIRGHIANFMGWNWGLGSGKRWFWETWRLNLATLTGY